jgi:hypothetical protein
MPLRDLDVRHARRMSMPLFQVLFERGFCWRAAACCFVDLA